jgi:hypothetical protein
LTPAGRVCERPRRWASTATPEFNTLDDEGDAPQPPIVIDARTGKIAPLA